MSPHWLSCWIENTASYCYGHQNQGAVLTGWQFTGTAFTPAADAARGCHGDDDDVVCVAWHNQLSDAAAVKPRRDAALWWTLGEPWRDHQQLCPCPAWTTRMMSSSSLTLLMSLIWIFGLCALSIVLILSLFHLCLVPYWDSGVVMRSDSFVELFVCLLIFLPYFLPYLFTSLPINFFENRPILFPGWRLSKVTKPGCSLFVYFVL